MPKKQKISRDEQEKIDVEKMQKRVEGLLPPKADIPAYISIQQAEELKERVSELEGKLAQQSDVNEKKLSPTIQETGRQSLPDLKSQSNASKSLGSKQLFRSPEDQVPKRQLRNFSLRNKLIGVVAFIFIVTAAVQFQISNVRSRQQVEAEAQERLKGYYQAYAGRIAAQSNAVGALASSIADRADVQELYLKGDRDGLYALLLPLFENLKERQIVHLYIENPDGTVFLRVHNPETFGDDITYRGTAADALMLKETTSGVEMGPNRMGVRGVSPMYSGNRFIGMVEVGLDFDEQFITDLKELTGADFAMWVTYESAAVPGLIPVKGVPGAPIEELFYYAGTNSQTLPVDPELYRSTLATGRPSFQTITENTSTPSIVYTTPLLGYKDKLFGLLEISFPYTDTLEALQASRISSLSVVGGLGLIGLFLMLIATSQFVLKPIESLNQFANLQMSGDTSTRVHVTSGDEFERLANTFNTLANSVEEERSTLEQRVADRTHDLELASEVGRTIAEKVGNVSLMLTDATEMIRARFNLYYTQVYLLDPSGQTITLRAGTGATGQQLLRRGHHLLVSSSSLNGRAVSEKKPVIVADTSKNDSFLPNPLLPKTLSEMAIPLLVGDKVLGVLDMQSEIPNALNEDNLAAFQVLAGQLSVAIQNAILFAQSEEARKQVEENVRQIATVGWQDFLNGTDRGEKIGYVFDQTEVKPLERKSKAKSNNALSVPITVTGATVGTIQVAQDEREWTSSETLIVQSTADQLAQHIENLRLLSQAEKYRQEAEQTTRRLTREGWEGYLQTRTALAEGYSFSPNEVIAENEDAEIKSSSMLSLPINVRDEAIGELTINTDNVGTNTVDEIFSAVASQLGEHIENLRLLETTQYELAERTRTEQELLKVRLGMDRTNDAVFITETDGTIIYINPAFERIYGWTAEEAIGKTPRILKSGVIPAEQYTHFWSALKNNQVVAGEIVNKTKDGRLIPIEGNNNPIVDSEGTIIGFLGMHRDITERKKAQEIIAQRANQLETVATVSSAAATMLDPDKLLQAIVDLTKERFNLYHTHIYLADDSWNTLLLAAGAGEVGRQMVDTGHAIQMDAERSLVARASRERTSIIVNDVRAEAGFLPNPMLPETRSEIAIPMIAGDKVIGVFDVQADSVDHFTDEDANIYTTLASQVAVALQNARLYMEQAATVTQLRELDRLKSSFLANMSHELRTPLNSILGFADVMLEGLDGPLTDNMNNDLGLIQKNGQHLLHLINDVLDMAKIDSGKMNLHIEKFNVHELFMDVTSITSSLAKEKSIGLIIETDSDHEVEINADKIRLRQVMINLVNNAMKFTEKGQVTICAHREENNILISVKDSGIGIPADHLELVFQEFTQVDTTTTRKAGGTGLGLPISRRLINMHSGRLWAESSGIHGEGSAFYVHLPIEANINENVTLSAN